MKLKTFWERLVRVLRQHISLTIIVVAALLLELTTGVQNYYAQRMIQNVVASLIASEMRSNSLYIQNQLVKVEDEADITTDWLNEVINANKRYASTERILLSQDNQVLAGNQPLADFLHLGSVVQSDPDHEGAFEATDKAGENLHVYYDPVGGQTGWTMVYVCYDSDMFGKLSRIRLYILLLALAGLALVAFIVYRTSRHLERLRQVNAEKERIDSELRVASGIQQSMLPVSHLQQDGVEIYGSLVPAREVGGDLYDYFIRDGKLFFCIGDVSGKGVPSAMVMSVVHSLFRMASASGNDPAQMMQIINDTLCEGNESNMFVTLFLGILELSSGRLCYCNAGHDAPVVLNEKHTQLDVKPNLPLGLYDDFAYEMQESTLVGGSMLFLYTDGLTEAKNNQRKLFGLERVMTVLQGADNLLPEQLLAKMTQVVHDFVEEAPQSDDLTMLAIKFAPVSFERALDERLTLQNDIHQVPKLNAFVKETLERIGVGPSLIKQLKLAVEEAVVNVMEYAYPTGETNDILLQISSDGQCLKFVIKDRGVAFDPTAQVTVDTTRSVDEQSIGGWGILLSREMMDSVSYERTDGMNVLTLIKQI